MQVTSSTAAGATASSSSSHTKPVNGGMHATGGFEQLAQQQLAGQQVIANTPMSRG